MAGRRKLLWVLLPLLALLAYAWLDAGREEMRDVVQPVPVPGTFK